MFKENDEKYIAITQSDIDELKEIYEEYLYMSRQHEYAFQTETIDQISSKHIKHMYPNCNPRNFIIPWSIDKLNIDEKQEFKNYTENNIRGDGRKTYVSLQHIRTEDNNGGAPIFVAEPYQNTTVAMQLPSIIEKYTLSFPKDATLSSTVFYIDGRHKMTYWGEKNKDALLMDCIDNQDLLTEITSMIYLGECSRKNDYKDDKKFGRMAVNVYATEILGVNENNLLEMLGMFAEKIRDICHSKYHQKKGIDDIKKAIEDGYLKISDDFQDYFNIRNFLRHQWDTLDDLDDFSLDKSIENKTIRAERANSMLKVCDKTLHQRMAFFIKALHQMQQVMSEVDPNFVVRNMSESNNKFIERVKAVCQQNPEKQISVEMNLSYCDKRYNALNGILHKKKLFTNVRVVDDIFGDNNRFERMDDYIRRSHFLRNCHGIESVAMGFCQRRAEDKSNRKAWHYLQQLGVISSDECELWQDYTTLRNKLTHDQFDNDLREQLRKIENKFEEDFCSMMKKIYSANPVVTKVGDNTFKYEHADGAVTIDYVTHKREKSPYAIKHQADLKAKKTEQKESDKSPQKQSCPRKDDQNSETINIMMKKLKDSKSL